jgi:tRNA modification GTPase
MAVAQAIAQAPQRLWLHNKADLVPETPPAMPGNDELRISARSGAGLPALHARLKALALGAGADAGEGTFSARARQVEALRRAATELQAAAAALDDDALDLAAEALRCGHDALGEVTGRIVPDALLGHIFSTFCVGK